MLRKTPISEAISARSASPRQPVARTLEHFEDLPRSPFLHLSQRFRAFNRVHRRQDVEHTEPIDELGPLGGDDVKPLPDPAPTDSGTVDGGGVLLLLGQNQADKTLEELTGSGGTTCGGTTGGGTTGGGTTDTTPVGGTVECDKESLTAAAKNSVDNFVSLEDWNCDQGWAVAFVVTEDYEETVVFEAEGQFWILKDRNDVCGTGPDDATIPSRCTTPAAPPTTPDDSTPSSDTVLYGPQVGSQVSLGHPTWRSLPSQYGSRRSFFRILPAPDLGSGSSAPRMTTDRGSL